MLFVLAWSALSCNNNQGVNGSPYRFKIKIKLPWYLTWMSMSPRVTMSPFFSTTLSLIRSPLISDGFVEER
jgi:hypothetical protein